MQTNFLGIWLTSIKGGQRPNESCEVPLCSLPPHPLLRGAGCAPTGVSFGFALMFLVCVCLIVWAIWTAVAAVYQVFIQLHPWVYLPTLTSCAKFCCLFIQWPTFKEFRSVEHCFFRIWRHFVNTSAKNGPLFIQGRVTHLKVADRYTGWVTVRGVCSSKMLFNDVVVDILFGKEPRYFSLMN